MSAHPARGPRGECHVSVCPPMHNVLQLDKTLERSKLVIAGSDRQGCSERARAIFVPEPAALRSFPFSLLSLPPWLHNKHARQHTIDNTSKPLFTEEVNALAAAEGNPDAIDYVACGEETAHPPDARGTRSDTGAPQVQHQPHDRQELLDAQCHKK
ncbi:hypothetical protein LX36DRAFT_672246 [Colletotrichum falcatum]|nr:hypothetical protein LX36DRAFT_672246 [Colletotrichum falcatum]